MEISGKDLERVLNALKGDVPNDLSIINIVKHSRLIREVDTALIKERAEAVTKRKREIGDIATAAFTKVYGGTATHWQRNPDAIAFYEAIIAGAKERGLV